jgi:hypothetical protein
MRDETVKITLITKTIKPRRIRSATTKTYQMRIRLDDDVWERLDKLAEVVEITSGNKLLENRLKNWINEGCPLTENLLSENKSYSHRAMILTAEQRAKLNEFLTENNMSIQDVAVKFAQI